MKYHYFLSSFMTLNTICDTGSSYNVFAVAVIKYTVKSNRRKKCFVWFAIAGYIQSVCHGRKVTEAWSWKNWLYNIHSQEQGVTKEYVPATVGLLYSSHLFQGLAYERVQTIFRIDLLMSINSVKNPPIYRHAHRFP